MRNPHRPSFPGQVQSLNEMFTAIRSGLDVGDLSKFENMRRPVHQRFDMQ